MSSPANGDYREISQMPIALPIGSLNGSGPKTPTTNGNRWSKICDWVSAHQKELIHAALIIGMIASASCFGIGLGVSLAGYAAAGFVGTYTGALTASEIVMMAGMMAFGALGLVYICPDEEF